MQDFSTHLGTQLVGLFVMLPLLSAVLTLLTPVLVFGALFVVLLLVWDR